MGNHTYLVPIILGDPLECGHDQGQHLAADHRVDHLDVNGVTVIENGQDTADVAEITSLTLPHVNDEYNPLLSSGLAAETTGQKK